MSRLEKTGKRWLAAPLAAVLFAASVTGFAALRSDGYTHGTKAVSELGAVGAPNALAFNLAGFVLPGLLIVLFALAIARASGRRAAPFLLAASGAMTALAGLAPADMADMASLSSTLHVVGAIGSGTLWVLALFWAGPMLRRDFGLEGWGKATPWFALFLFANLGWQVLFQTTGLVLPGWGQRIGFFGYFLWFAVTGFLLWRAARTEAGI